MSHRLRRRSGNWAFTAVTAGGGYTFELQGPLDHPIEDGTLDGELLPGLGIDFSGVLTAVDGDGDPLAGGFNPGSFVINVEARPNIHSNRRMGVRSWNADRDSACFAMFSARSAISSNSRLIFSTVEKPAGRVCGFTSSL